MFDDFVSALPWEVALPPRLGRESLDIFYS
jgi:hypothetical protein